MAWNNRKNLSLGLLLGAGPHILINGITLFGFGPWSIPGIELFEIPGFFFGFVVLPLALLSLFSEKLRGRAAMVAHFSFTLFAASLSGFWCGMSIRTTAFSLAATRAQPLVGAIKAYERNNGGPPQELSVLIPKYLSVIPSRIPVLKIITGEQARKDYYGNPWALVAHFNAGAENVDKFIYVPNQNYPSRKSFERVAQWVYFHEYDSRREVR